MDSNIDSTIAAAGLNSGTYIWGVRAFDEIPNKADIRWSEPFVII